VSILHALNQFPRWIIALCVLAVAIPRAIVWWRKVFK
jgi:hypothetical protein